MKNNNSQIVKKDIISSYNLARNCSKVFVESVHARNHNDAIETAKARNPKAKVVGVNPNFKD